MPFSMKIQPVDEGVLEPESEHEPEPVKPVVKWRLKRLFERQFLRTCSTDKSGVEELHHVNKDVSDEIEPSSVCLAKMVQNFIEDRPEDKHGRNRCNCFNGNCSDSSDDEHEFCDTDILKSLVQCASVCERNLLADTAKILEKNKACKSKDVLCRRVVADELVKLGYDASVCKSRWEKTSSFPAGEYEYIDVVFRGERLIVDIVFRSEFEIARATMSYKSILHTLPHILVSKPDRLKKIIAVVSEAAKRSLKKKGMHVPPWRKVDYVKAKWFSPYTRVTQQVTTEQAPLNCRLKHDKIQYPVVQPGESTNGEIDILDEFDLDCFFAMSERSGEEEKEDTKETEPWLVIEAKSSPFPKKSGPGGLASIMGLEP